MQRNLPRFSALAIIFLFVVCDMNLTHAQSTLRNIPEGFPVRLGQGVSVTTHRVQSTYLASSINLLEKRDWLNLRIEGSVDLLDNPNQEADFVVGAVPVARVSLGGFPFSPFFELGVGVNYVSNMRLGGRALGANILFSPTISGGIRLNNYFTLLSLAYTFRHLSNAGLHNDNDGINFQYITLAFGI